MELIISLLLGVDAKKGEKVLKSNCNQLQLKDTYDEDGPGGDGKRMNLFERNKAEM